MNPRFPFPVIGGITGSRHLPQGTVFSGGRSLHPLQRNGQVPTTHLPSVGAMGVPGLGSAPAAAPPALGMPPILNVSAFIQNRV